MLTSGSPRVSLLRSSLAKFILAVLVASLFVAGGVQTPATAAAANNPERVSAIEADGALWVGAATPNGSPSTSMTFQATLDTAATPTVVGTCTVSYSETYVGQVKRCKISGLTNGTGYHVRAYASNTDGDSAWVWEAWGPFTPSATVAQIFSGGSADCSYWPSEAHPCGNNNVDTTVTMPGQNLQNCTAITGIGGGGGPIPITPAGDGSSITFTIPAGLYGWVDFNWTCGLGNRSAFLGNNIGSLAQYSGYTPYWSQNSGSTSGGSQVTLTTSSPVFYGITSLTLQGHAVTYTVVDMYTLRMTIPAGTAGYADLVMVNSNGTGTQSNAYLYTAPTPPDTPNAPTVTPGDGKVTVTPNPAGTGGTPTSYTVTASPGGATCTVTLPDTSCDVTGLTNGTTYTFTVTASNDGGTSSSSSASSGVAPSAGGGGGGGGGGTTLTADQTSVSMGGHVNFTTDADSTMMAAIFFDGEIPAPVDGNAWFGQSGSTPNPFEWSDFPTCHTGTLTYRIYDVAPGLSHPAWSDTYAATIDVTWVGDPSACLGLNVTANSLANGETLWVSAGVGAHDMIAFFVDGVPAYYFEYGGGGPVPWEVFGGCTNATLTIRVYTYAPGVNPPAWSDAYTETVDISLIGDPTLQSCGGGTGHSGGGSSSKPEKPKTSDVQVSSGAGSLHIQANYSGSYLNSPAYYRVTVSPGGNSCVTNSQFGSCDIYGLDPNVSYTVTIVAVNNIGASAGLVLPNKYRLAGASTLKMVASKTIAIFAGGSAKLTNAFKISVSKYLKAHPTLMTFTCTGYIAGKAITKTQKKLALARANAVCGYIHKLRPGASVTTIGKTPGLKYVAANRKVIIRAYGS